MKQVLRSGWAWASLALALIVGGALFRASPRRVLPALYPDLQLFQPAIQKARPYALKGRPTGLILPHHLLVRQSMANAFASVRGGGYRRVVLICPDHYRLGSSPITVVNADFATPFGTVRSDDRLIRGLAKVPGVTASDVHYREHGFGSLLPFLHEALPDAKVCILTLKANVTRLILDGLFEVLSREVDQDTLIVQSTDFSHYLTATVAETKDATSRDVLLSEDPARALTLVQPDHTDSIGAFYVQARLQREVFKSHPHILEHLNSQAFADHPVDRTTSYFVVAYTPDFPPDMKSRGDGSILFTGDVMLGRGVAALAQRHGLDHPFTGLASQFQSATAVLINLEGPLSPPLRPEAPLRFHFAPEFASAMASAGVTHASLANNHGLDQGPEGFVRTCNYLRESNITALGHPAWNTKPAATSLNIGGRSLRLVAFNATEPYFQLKENSAFLRHLRSDAPQAFIAVSIHWGQEFMSRAHTEQRRFAHAFIEAGADLVVGHHPHVVQDLERYRGRIIAYSLGNLIFDQWAKPEASRGLILKLQLKESLLELIPVDTTGTYSSLTQGSSRQHALEALARISPEELRKEILDGRLQLTQYSH